VPIRHLQEEGVPIRHLLLRLGEMSMAQTHIWQLPGHEQLFLVLVPPLEESLTASQKRATVCEWGQCGPGQLVDSAWRELLSPAHWVVDSAVPG
jgi:hypothetical protein